MSAEDIAVLRVTIPTKSLTRKMRLNRALSVADIIADLTERTGEGSPDHGLFQPAREGKFASPPRWLAPEKTLNNYEIQEDDEIVYRAKKRRQQIKTLDGTTRTIMVDDTQPVLAVITQMLERINITFSEEYGMQAEGNETWLEPSKTLLEQNVDDQAMLVLKKKLFMFDKEVVKDEEMQVHVIYIQSREQIMDGKYPTSEEEALDLAVLDAQIQFGSYDLQKEREAGPTAPKPVKAEFAAYVTKIKKDIRAKCLPPILALHPKDKNIEHIFAEYKKLSGAIDLRGAKYRYVQKAQSLKTFGITTFAVKLKVGRALKEELFGVTRDAILRMDPITMDVIKRYPLIHIKRWGGGVDSFTLDFGGHDDDYLNMVTKQGAEINKLISGYVDLIVKMRNEANKPPADPDVKVAVPDAVDSPEGTATSFRAVKGQVAPGLATPTPAPPPANPQRTIQRMPKVPAAQIIIDDVPTAKHAMLMLGEELGAAKPTAIVREIAGSAGQLREQMVQSYNAVRLAAMDVFKNMEDGKQTMSKATLIENAKMAMAQALELGNKAKFASSEEIGVSMLEATRCLVGSLAGIYGICEETSEGVVLTPEQQIALKEAQQRFTAASALMEAVLTGKGIVDINSSAMMIECSKNLASTAQDMFAGLTAHSISVADPAKKKAFLEAAQKAVDLVFVANSIAATMAPASLIPACKAEIVNAVQAVKDQLATVLTLANELGIEPSEIKAIHAKVQMVSDGIAAMLQSLEVGEPLKGVRSEQVGEFVDSIKDFSGAFTELRESVGNRARLVNATKQVASVVCQVVAKGKALSIDADPATRMKLLDSAKEISDLINKLFQGAKASAEDVDDKKKQEALLSVAEILQEATQEMIFISGKNAAAASLRREAKGLVASCVTNVASCKENASLIPEAYSDDMLAAANNLGDLNKALASLVRVACKDPSSSSAQVELLDQAELTCAAALRMIVASNNLVENLKMPEAAKLFSEPATKTKTAVDLVEKACQAFREINGQTSIAEICEELNAMLAEVEITETAIATGYLERTNDRVAHAEAVTLLNESAKTLTNASQELVTAAKSNPRKLPQKTSLLSDANSQVVTAAKAVVQTLPTKAQQFSILNLTKELTHAVQELIDTGKLLKMKPNDEPTRVALELNQQKVLTAIANLLSSDVDSKEIDSAVESLKQQIELLTPVKNEKIALRKATEHVATCSKALSAGLSQLAVCVQTNPTGVASSAKAVSSSVPALISAANLAAGASPNEATSAQVLEATKALVEQASSVIRLSKAAVLDKNGSSGMNKTLLDAVKNVSGSIGRLLRTLGAVSNNECEEALESISGIVKDLDNVEGVQPITPAVAVRQIAEISKILLEEFDGILSCAQTDPGALGNHARATAQQVRLLIDTTRAMTAKEVPYVPEKFLGPAEQLSAAVANIGATDQLGNIAKVIQTSVTSLLTAAVDEAGRPETSKEQSGNLRKNAAALKNLVPQFAAAAKSVVSGDPAGKADLATVQGNFKETIKKLLEVVTVHPTAKDALPEEKKEKVIAAAREVGTNASQLIYGAMAVSAKPQDTDLRSTMADNCATAVESVKTFVKIGSGVVPGADQVETSVDSLQGIDSELAAASMAVAVGSIGGSSSGTIPHAKLQEMLVSQSKVVGIKLAAVESASRVSTAAVGKAAEECSAAVKEIGTTAIQAAATTSDTDLQADLVNNAKSLSDASLKLVQSAFTCACSASPDSIQEVGANSQAASQALGQLVSKLGASSTLLNDMDEALAVIHKSSAQLSTPLAPPPATVTYQQCKAEITNACKGITAGVRSLSTAEKVNLVQLGNTAKGVAQVCTTLPQSLMYAKILAPSPEIGNAIVAQGNQLLTTSQAVVRCAKELAQDPKNKALAAALASSFQACTKSVTELLNTAKKGAVGEQMCNDAMEAIKKVVAEADAAMMFASAGQLETSSNKKPAQLHQELSATVQQISDQIARLQEAAKTSSEIAVGEAVKGIAEKVGALAQHCSASASAFRNNATQQELLSAGKASALSTQALVFASKSARGNNPAGLKSLAKAAEGVSDSLGQLMRMSQRAIDDLARGTKDVQAAKIKVNEVITKYPAKTEPVKDATAKRVVDTAKSIVANSVGLTSAIVSNNQEEMSRIAQVLIDQTSSMLADTAGINLQLPQKPAVQTTMNHAVVATAKHVEELLAAGAALAVADDSAKPTHKAQLEKASAALAMTLNNIGDNIKHYPGGEDLAVEETHKEAEELEILAEKEIKKCIQAIDAGATKLLASKPAVKPKAPGAKLDQADISSIIKDGAAAIATASSNLMKYAATAQASRLALCQAGSVKYRSDPLWVNSLIAAAQAVAAKVAALVGAASKPNPTEDEVVATASSVSVATAALVNATKQRTEEVNSVEQQNMSNAAKAVAASTVALVTAAKKALEPVEAEETGTSTVLTGSAGGFDWELEKQIEIEKIEAQLRRARTNMQKLRQPGRS